ncbi:MAG: 50S ribosomal protein L27 [Candidatus Omnitrophota bacterium]|jgi:large subunit ribosomal protein L27
MAHTKAKGTTKLGRDSESKRLGVKIYGGSPIKCGQIIIRQRGTAYFAGEGVKTGKDDTLYATADGTVQFKKIRYTNFNGNKKIKQRVSVSPVATLEHPKPAEKTAKVPAKTEEKEA